MRILILDILRDSICLAAPRFLAALYPNFLAKCLHITSKFRCKAAQNSQALPSKASYARCLLLVVCLTTFCAHSAEPNQTLVVHNRVLVRIRERSISTADVIKKMNVFLERNYPDALYSPIARHQFYSTHWKQTLQQMVDHQLILADADEKEFSVDEATIREELMKRFGPNVMSYLEKVGISYEEMHDMLKIELTVQQMIGYRVHNKALLGVHPQDIKRAYKRYCNENPSLDQCTYQILSVRADNPDISRHIAEKASLLLKEEGADFASVVEKIEQEIPQTAALSISQEYQAPLHALNKEHKAVLAQLEPNAYSNPAEQLSRINNTLVHRIFHLKERAHIPTSSFREMEPKLRETLLDQVLSEQTVTYLTKLRKRFGYEDEGVFSDIPPEFTPCSLIAIAP